MMSWWTPLFLVSIVTIVYMCQYCNNFINSKVLWTNKLVIPIHYSYISVCLSVHPSLPLFQWPIYTYSKEFVASMSLCASVPVFLYGSCLSLSIGSFQSQCSHSFVFIESLEFGKMSRIRENVPNLGKCPEYGPKMVVSTFWVIFRNPGHLLLWNDSILSQYNLLCIWDIFFLFQAFWTFVD